MSQSPKEVSRFQEVLQNGRIILNIILHSHLRPVRREQEYTSPEENRLKLLSAKTYLTNSLQKDSGTWQFVQELTSQAEGEMHLVSIYRRGAKDMSTLSEEERTLFQISKDVDAQIFKGKLDMHTLYTLLELITGRLTPNHYLPRLIGQ